MLAMKKEVWLDHKVQQVSARFDGPQSLHVKGGGANLEDKDKVSDFLSRNIQI